MEGCLLAWAADYYLPARMSYSRAKVRKTFLIVRATIARNICLLP